MSKLITSSGIIRDRELPRTGVTSELDAWWDEIDQGIDLAWEEMLLDLKREGLEEGSEAWERRTQEASDMWERGTVLFGDWAKDRDGLYMPNRFGPSGFAATYNPDTNCACVEWSKTTTPCHNTSPCYVMSDGRGPCGDLDTEGDNVIAYCFPKEEKERA